MSQPRSKKSKAADNTRTAMALFKRSLTSGSSQGSFDHTVPDSQHPSTSEPPLQPQTMPSSSIPAPPFGRTLISAGTKTQIEEDGAIRGIVNDEMVESKKRKLRSLITLSMDESVNSPAQFDHENKIPMNFENRSSVPLQDMSETECLIRENKELKAMIVELEEKNVYLEESTSNLHADVLDMKQKLDWIVSHMGCQLPIPPRPRDDDPVGG